MLNRKISGKKSVIGTVIAALCIVAYFVVFVVAVTRIYSSVEQRRIDAEFEFFDISDLALSAGRIGFGDELFVEVIQRRLNESRTLEGVIITSSRGDFSFEKDPGRTIRFVNGDPRFVSRWDLSRQQLFRPLQIEGLRNVTIQAVASTFDLFTLTDVLRQTLLWILIPFAISFFTLLFEALQKGQGRKAVLRERNAQKSREKNESDAVSDSPPVDPVPAPTPGGYSQRGRVVREEHTEIRVTEELARSAQADCDLAFIIIELKPPVDDFFYARFAADAARFFSSRDFICEKGEKGISVICPGLNLDTGFLNADEFHNRIMGKYPAYFKSKTDLCIGLSARSGRPVNAERLMFEAEEALERAMMDPVSHVVAFKSDPEKFKAFMERTRS